MKLALSNAGEIDRKIHQISRGLYLDNGVEVLYQRNARLDQCAGT